MTAMLEKVAMAMYAWHIAEYGHLWDKDSASHRPWEQQAKAVCDAYRSQARAALEAMREPTEEMLAEWAFSTTGNTDWNSVDDDQMRRAWRAMIDGALKDPPA